tara:strand:+ start:3545 stop:3880 length:336 start_codon:yes stop_codon:yes gene_type:complete
MDTTELIKDEANKIINLLLEKNKAYGDTANNPPQIFSKLEAVEGLCARIDDKLSRIKTKGITDLTEDTVSDLIGYLILLKVQLRKQDEVIKEKLIAKKNEKKTDNFPVFFF